MASASPSTSNPVINSKALAEELLERCKQVAKGKTLGEAGITADWVESYAKIAERADREQRYGLSRYPFQAGNAVSAFIGGFFDNDDWPLKRKLAKQQSMYAVAEHEAKYINSAGYWSALHHVAYQMRQEAFEKDNKEEAEKYDAWAYVAVRYSLRVLGLRAEFYRMAAKDPMYAKLVLPSLERRGETAMADDLDDSLATLESHLSTQMFKAVATLKASNETKRAKGKGGAADGN